MRHVRAEQEALELSRGRLAPYFVAGLTVIALVLASIRALTDQACWPIDNMDLRLQIVTWTIGLSAVPWLVLVWLTALRLRHPPPKDLHDSLPSVTGLLRAWAMLSECVFAFASFVVIAILTTGALRAVRLTEESNVDFPESDVLLYGLYFSVLMAAVTVPLVVDYRKRAYELVNERYPAPVDARVSEGMGRITWASRGPAPPQRGHHSNAAHNLCDLHAPDHLGTRHRRTDAGGPGHVHSEGEANGCLSRPGEHLAVSRRLCPRETCQA